MSIRPVTKVDDWVKVNNVIISVSDKSDLDLLVGGLVEVNPDVKIYSTGGTFTAIENILGADSGKNLVSVSDYIQQPETEGGLVKTLDFLLFLGYLTETHCEAHQQDLARTGAVPMDLVVFNLYPYQDTVKKFEKGLINPNTGVPFTLEDVRGNIDVGGPSSLRAAAKNWIRILSSVDPNDYGPILSGLRETGGHTTIKNRFELHKKVFRHLATYNTAIADFVEGVDAVDALKGYEIMNVGGK